MNVLRFNAIAAALAVSFSISATLAHAAPGDLDPSFGTIGYVMTKVQDLSGADAVLVDAKQRIVVAGSSSSTALSHMSPTLMRYLPDGTLDTSFGESANGIEFVTPPAGLSGYADFCCVRLDSKNRIVVAGFSEFPSPTGMQKVLTVARLSEDGTPDERFGMNGMITNVVAGGEAASTAQSLTIDASDRIIVGGATFDGSANGTPVLIRYDVHGLLDRSFGKAGIVTVADASLFSSAPVGVAVDSTGRIVAAENHVAFGTGQETFVARFTDDGTPDSTFGFDGSGMVELANVRADAFALDSADRPIIASAIIDGTNMGMTRLTPDGLPDPTFGSDGNGTVTTPADELITPHAIAIDATGNIVMSAVADDFSDPTNVEVLRYTTDGSLDSSFGDGGIALPSLPDSATANGVAIDASGAITISGYANDDTGVFQFTTARLQN